MNQRKPPYIEWALDRWKLLLILLLFVLLLVGTLFWPEEPLTRTFSRSTVWQTTYFML